VEALSTFEESHEANRSYSRSYRPECERVCTPVRTQTTETLRRGSYFRHGASGLTGRVDTVESMLAVSVYPARQVKCGLFRLACCFYEAEQHEDCWRSLLWHSVATDQLILP